MARGGRGLNPRGARCVCPAMTTRLQRPTLLVLLALAALAVAGFAATSGGAAEPTAAATANTTHTATKAGSFDTKGIAPGKSKTVQFDKRGTFAYHCKIHPFMKGKIVVE